jgi:hypothetical protein
MEMAGRSSEIAASSLPRVRGAVVAHLHHNNRRNLVQMKKIVEKGRKREIKGRNRFS